MNSFTLILQQATGSQSFEQVKSFIGIDASGSFGILAEHAPMMTILSVGLARFRIMDEPWQYIAMPGAVLSFHGNKLVVSTRHYLLDSDYELMTASLQQQLATEEAELASVKRNLRLMEEALLKRMWQVGELGTGS